MLKKPQLLLALLIAAAFLLLYAANSQFNSNNHQSAVTATDSPPNANVALNIHTNKNKSASNNVNKNGQYIVAADLATPANSTQTQRSFIEVSDDRPTQAPRKIKIDSLEELSALFDSLNYNTQSWNAGNREVPRLMFQSVSKRWQENASKIPVQEKR